MGVAHVKCQICWVCLKIHALRFIESVPHVEPPRGGHPRNINPAQRRECVRAMTIGGHDNVVDMRIVLSEHLKIVVSTNTMRHALHKACRGSLEKQEKSLLKAKNVCCRLEFAMSYQDWTIHNLYRVIFHDDTKIKWFNLMAVLGVG
jgi:hypothetical protein